MVKRWSSGREDLPIFHEERPLIESIYIVTVISSALLAIAIVIVIMFFL